MGGSTVDVTKFNIEALKVLESLLMFGYFREHEKLFGIARICFAAMCYHIQVLHPEEQKKEEDNESENSEDISAWSGGSNIGAISDTRFIDLPRKSRTGYLSLSQADTVHNERRTERRMYESADTDGFDSRGDDSKVTLSTSRDTSVDSTHFPNRIVNRSIAQAVFTRNKTLSLLRSTG